MDFYPHPIHDKRVSENERETNRSARKLEELQGELAVANEALAKLRLLSKAMWQILKERADLADADLDALVARLELEESEARDGNPLVCSECGRERKGRRETCLYCGTHFPPGEIDLFEI